MSHVQHVISVWVVSIFVSPVISSASLVLCCQIVCHF